MTILQTPNPDSGNFYVPVFVPRERLAQIYRVLADTLGTAEPEVASGPGQMPDDSAEMPEESAEAAPGSDDDAWSGTADERFRDRAFVDTHLVPRSDTVRDAAKYLAQRAGTWITSEEIATALGLPHGWNSLAGAFGAAGRYFANRDIALPWDWTYYTPDGRIRLRMDPEIAKVILEAL